MPPTLAAVLPSIQGLTPQCEGPGGITSATSPQAFYYCDFCDLAELINNILNLLVFVGTCMAIIAFIWAGVTMVMAQGNPTKLSQGKSIFKNVFVGFVLMLAAWLIIDVVMKTLTNLDGEDPRFGPWNEVLCPDGFDPKENQAENFDAGLQIKVSEVVPGVPGATTGGSSGGGATGSTYQGSCTKNASGQVAASASCVKITGASVQASGKYVDKSFNDRFQVFLRNLAGATITVTEAFPPSRNHAATCHQGGGCVDIDFSGTAESCANVTKVVKAAQAAGMVAQYEFRTVAEQQALLKQPGCTLTDASVKAYSTVSGSHFSLYRGN